MMEIVNIKNKEEFKRKIDESDKDDVFFIYLKDVGNDSLSINLWSIIYYKKSFEWVYQPQTFENSKKLDEHLDDLFKYDNLIIKVHGKDDIYDNILYDSFTVNMTDDRYGKKLFTNDTNGIFILEFELLGQKYVTYLKSDGNAYFTNSDEVILSDETGFTGNSLDNMILELFLRTLKTKIKTNMTDFILKIKKDIIFFTDTKNN